MVSFICLAFVAQTMASTVMSYHMMNMKGMSEMRGQAQSYNMSTMSSKMDHSAHNMAMSSDSSTNTFEESSNNCCEDNCKCLTGSCLNVAVLIKDIGNNCIIDLSSKILSISMLVKNQRLTSLYRPPILS